jgi:sulfatase modifying factor 1
MRSRRRGWLLVPGAVLGVLIVLLLLGLGKRPPQPTPVVVNSIGMQLVPIPAGDFLMGGQESADRLVRAFPAHNRKADEFRDESPSHRVRITRPFHLGQFEVTVGQFRRATRNSIGVRLLVIPDWKGAIR